MAVTRRSNPYWNRKTGKNDDAISADVLLSPKTTESVVVFACTDDFAEIAGEALAKQCFAPLPARSESHLDGYCSKRYLNYLLDCDRPDLHDVHLFMASIRSRVPNCFIIAYCSNPGWASRLKEAGADAVIDSADDVALRIMEASIGFRENINDIVSQHLRSGRRRIKEMTIRSRMEKATAAATHLSLEHMLQTDANVRAFCANSWPASRHGQFVAIVGGETIGFAGDAVELAEQVRGFRPSGNILIQRMDCEDDSFRRYVT